MTVTTLTEVTGSCAGILTSQHKTTYHYKGISFDAAKSEYQLSATRTSSSLGLDYNSCSYGPMSSGATVTSGFKRRSFADLIDVTLRTPAFRAQPRGTAVGSVDRRPIGATYMYLKFGDGHIYQYLVDIRESAEATELRSHFLRLREIDSRS